MNTIIRKRPSDKNLEAMSISITPTEFDIIHNNKVKSSIHIYNKENELVYVIERKDYKKLTAVPKTMVNRVTQQTTPIFVVDFSEVI